MSSRQHARHRTADGGLGRPDPAEQRPEGRHRIAAGRPTPVRSVLAAGGGVAAALTAVVLSGAQGPLGALFPERVEEPRPTTASASPRNGAPTATDVARVASFSPAPGVRGGLSLWDVLFQQGVGGPGAMPGMLDGESLDAVWEPRGAGVESRGAPFLPAAGVPSAPAGTAAPVLPTAPSTPSVGGNGGPARSEPRVAGPDGGTPTDPLVPAEPPVKALPPAPTSSTGPVITAAEPLVKAAEPVVETARPVIPAVEPEPSPVVEAPAPVVEAPDPVVPAPPVRPELPEPAEDPDESVVQAVPEAPAPEAPKLPAGTGDGDLPAG